MGMPCEGDAKEALTARMLYLSVITSQVYEQAIVTVPPECVASLRRQLQAGPTTRVYARGDGFSLRMPQAELPEWQTVNEKGKVSNVPRPAHDIRCDSASVTHQYVAGTAAENTVCVARLPVPCDSVWDAASRRYKPIDPQLSGAPTSDEGTVPRSTARFRTQTRRVQLL